MSIRVDQAEDERLAANLRFIQEAHRGDIEVIHAMMDQLIIDTLRFHGYSKAAEVYERSERWCA